MPRSYVPLSRTQVAGLIELARGGSALAAGELLDACRGYLLMIANGQLDAELRGKLGGSDLVQETFLDAHRDFARFQGGSERELLAWLRKILLNQIARARRDFQQTAKRDIAREQPQRRDGSTADGRVLVVARGETPSREVVAREESHRVEQFIAKLPVQYAEIIRLRSRERMEYAEIGLRMNLGPDAARKLWARAIERLQRDLNEAE